MNPITPGHLIRKAFLIIAILFFIVPVSMAQEPKPEEPATTPVTAEFGDEELIEVDWIQEMRKGGVTMIALATLSIIGMGILLERLATVRRGKFVPQAVCRKVGEFEKTGDPQALQDTCQGRRDLLSRSINLAFERQNDSPEAIQTAVAEFAGREFRHQFSRAQLLAAVAGIAPLLGLLGTMIGMIESFQLVSVYGDEGGAAILAKSISKALITTAAGLVVAIPALASYHWVRHRILGIANELEPVIGRVLRRMDRSSGDA